MKKKIEINSRPVTNVSCVLHLIIKDIHLCSINRCKHRNTRDHLFLSVCNFGNFRSTNEISHSSVASSVE
jgi:hypothetical protein